MPLIILLTTLCIDRLLWQADPYRQHTWFNGYARWLLGRGDSDGPGWARNPFGALLVLLPLLVLLLLFENLFGQGMGGLAELAFGTAVLLFSLGPDDLGRQTEAYLRARDSGNDAEATALARSLVGGPVPEDEPDRTLSVAATLPVTALRRMFAPICWFVLLGPLGAALYRLNELLLCHLVERDAPPATLLQSSRRLQYLLDWLPARLSAASMALAGNFDAVAQAWKHYRAQASGDDNTGLLQTLSQAALLSWPGEGELAVGELPPVVEDALALVWRSLVVWVLFVAAISLIEGLF